MKLSVIITAITSVLLGLLVHSTRGQYYDFTRDLQDPGEPPVEPSEPPTDDPTPAPTEPTDAPTEPTDAPTAPTLPPTDAQPTDGPTLPPTGAQPSQPPTDAAPTDPSSAMSLSNFELSLSLMISSIALLCWER